MRSTWSCNWLYHLLVDTGWCKGHTPSTWKVVWSAPPGRWTSGVSAVARVARDLFVAFFFGDGVTGFRLLFEGIPEAKWDPNDGVDVLMSAGDGVKELGLGQGESFAELLWAKGLRCAVVPSTHFPSTLTQSLQNQDTPLCLAILRQQQRHRHQQLCIPNQSTPWFSFIIPHTHSYILWQFPLCLILILIEALSRPYPSNRPLIARPVVSSSPSLPSSDCLVVFVNIIKSVRGIGWMLDGAEWLLKRIATLMMILKGESCCSHPPPSSSWHVSDGVLNCARCLDVSEFARSQTWHWSPVPCSGRLETHHSSWDQTSLNMLFPDQCHGHRQQHQTDRSGCLVLYPQRSVWIHHARIYHVLSTCHRHPSCKARSLLQPLKHRWRRRHRSCYRWFDGNP